MEEAQRGKAELKVFSPGLPGCINRTAAQTHPSVAREVPPLPVPRQEVPATSQILRGGGAVTARGSAAETPRCGRRPQIQPRACLDPLV
eukprot:14956304-Alexandrium_andersonii.AAC.1